MQEVVFPDGVRVYAGGRGEWDQRPLDFGLFLYEGWRGTPGGVIVGWPDFGVPDDPTAVRTAICAAYERAKDGERVAVGCHAGLGRTGTVLACMATLAGVPPADAVGWVRRNYRGGAVETIVQEQFVLAFAAR